MTEARWRWEAAMAARLGKVANDPAILAMGQRDERRTREGLSR
jgi:hypothetical protein